MAHGLPVVSTIGKGRIDALLVRVARVDARDVVRS
jgi:hypothetical protein